MSGEEILVCAVQLGENFSLYFAGNYYLLLKESYCVFFLHRRSKAHIQFNPFPWASIRGLVESCHVMCPVPSCVHPIPAPPPRVT